jgi:glycerol-3-phosphate acyltransferase PlsY
MSIDLFIGLFFIAAVSYLFGSVNLAVILSRKMQGQDVRKHGSGNAGATNMLRTFGWKAAAMTFIGDLIKGYICVVVGRAVITYLGYHTYAVYGGYVGGIAALVGQMYPVYFGFKGGKGVATATGVIGANNPVLFLILCTVGFSLSGITGYVSVGSLVGAVGYPLLVLAMMLINGRFDLIELAFAVLLGVIIIIGHKSNLKRLLNGTENKFTPKKKS